MGQRHSDAACSLSTLHLCASDDGAPGRLLLPSSCRGLPSAPCSGLLEPHAVHKTDQALVMDMNSKTWYPGTGAFGFVLLAVKARSAEAAVVKVVGKRRCDRDQMLCELDVLLGLDHPSLARLREVVEDARTLRLVMEAAPGRDLFSAVAAATPRLSEGVVAALLRQLLAGLQHLHAAGLAHEEVHPRNILAASGPAGPELRLKLIDFGLARKFSRGSVSAVHCIRCLAPEQITEATNPRSAMLAPTFDIWAVGVLGFVLLSGLWPMDAEDKQLLRKKVAAGLWAFVPAGAWNVSARARAFVSTLLASDAGKRPCAAKALELPFLQLHLVDKPALQPLARSAEVLASLRRLSSWDAIVFELVGAIALQLTATKIADFGKHLSNRASHGTVTFGELRHGLVSAGIALPGHLLQTVLALPRDETRTLLIRDICDTAAARRQLVEETALWSLWTRFLPGGAAATRAQLVQLLDQGGALLQQVFGGGSGANLDPNRPDELPEQLSFDDLLARLRAASKGERLRAPPTRQGDWQGAPRELVLRMPPPPDLP